jgi:hypothetical protein
LIVTGELMIASRDGGEGAALSGAWQNQSTKSSDVAAIADLRAFSEISNRPLFVATRRRATPVAQKSVAVMVPPPPLSPPPADKLLAVVIGPTRSVAVLHLTNGSTRVVAQGERLNEWVLTNVMPDHITLSSSTRHASLIFQARTPGGNFATPDIHDEFAPSLLRRR